MTNYFHNQHMWPHYHVIHNIQKNNNPTSQSCARIHIGQISYIAPAANNSDESQHNTDGTVLSHSGILTLLPESCNGIVIMNSRDNVTLYWLPELGIILKKWCFLRSCMAHTWWWEFVMVWQWSRQLVNYLKTPVFSMLSWSIQKKLVVILCILLVLFQQTTTSGNTLSAMFTNFGSLMNCISCFRV